MKTFSGSLKKLHTVKVEAGEDMLESLENAVSKLKINDAVIIDGAGSVQKYNLHVVETNNLPPGNIYFDDSTPWDLLTTTGYIIDGRIHAHITLSNHKVAIGGHLEKGTRALTFIIVSIAEIEGDSLANLDSFSTPA